MAEAIGGKTPRVRSGKRKAKGRAPDGPTSAIADILDNGPDDDDILVAVHQLTKFEADKKELAGRITAYKAKLKGRGFDLKILKARMDQLGWTPAEQRLHAAKTNRYARAMHQHVADDPDQLELFGSPQTPEVIKDQMRWRETGFKHGAAGIGWPDEPPAGCPPEMRSFYSAGHEDGNQRVTTAIARQLALEEAQAAPADEARVAGISYEEEARAAAAKGEGAADDEPQGEPADGEKEPALADEPVA